MWIFHRLLENLNYIKYIYFYSASDILKDKTNEFCLIYKTKSSIYKSDRLYLRLLIFLRKLFTEFYVSDELELLFLIL